MRIADGLILALAIAFALLIYFGAANENKVCFFVGEYSFILVEFIFAVTWGSTLHKLYKNTEDSKRLLPKKKIFKLHGVLLAITTAFSVINGFTVWKELSTRGRENQNAFYFWFGLSNITFVLTSWFESATFLIVISLMLPVSEE